MRIGRGGCLSVDRAHSVRSLSAPKPIHSKGNESNAFDDILRTGGSRDADAAAENVQYIAQHHNGGREGLGGHNRVCR